MESNWSHINIVYLDWDISYTGKYNGQNSLTMTHSQEKKQAREIDHDMAQMLDLADKDFKAAFIHRSKEVKKNLILTNVQVENISREIKTLKEAASRNSRTEKKNN